MIGQCVHPWADWLRPKFLMLTPRSPRLSVKNYMSALEGVKETEERENSLKALQAEGHGKPWEDDTTVEMK